jgi:hypothetical protein
MNELTCTPNWGLSLWEQLCKIALQSLEGYKYLMAAARVTTLQGVED